MCLSKHCFYNFYQKQTCEIGTKEDVAQNGNFCSSYLPVIFSFIRQFSISVTFNFCSTRDFLKLVDKTKSPPLYDNFRIEREMIEITQIRSAIFNRFMSIKAQSFNFRMCNRSKDIENLFLAKHATAHAQPGLLSKPDE